MAICLQSHSWWSFMEGVASPSALVTAACRRGIRVLALTDTNGLHGALEFIDAASAQGVRPVVGATLVLGGQRLVVLAGEASGWATLCRLLTRVRLSGRVRSEEHTSELQSH